MSHSTHQPNKEAPPARISASSAIRPKAARSSALAEKSWHHVFERWVLQLELSFPLTAHRLRHTFITALIDRGANIFLAQELAGHESPETTRIYYRLSGEHLKHVIACLPDDEDW